MALVQQAANSEPGVVNTITASLTGVASGNRLVVCITERDGNALSSISDSVNGAWTLAGNGVSFVNASRRAAVYSFPNSAAGNPTITVTISGIGQKDINFSEWSSGGTGGADTTNTNANASGTSHTAGSVTPSAAALVVAVMGFAGNHGGTSNLNGFTALTIHGSANANQQIYGYKTGHTGAVNPTFVVTNTVTSDATVAAFLEAGGGGGARFILGTH